MFIVLQRAGIPEPLQAFLREIYSSTIQIERAGATRGQFVLPLHISCRSYTCLRGHTIRAEIITEMRGADFYFFELV